MFREKLATHGTKRLPFPACTLFVLLYGGMSGCSLIRNKHIALFVLPFGRISPKTHFAEDIPARSCSHSNHVSHGRNTEYAVLLKLATGGAQATRRRQLQCASVKPIAGPRRTRLHQARGPTSPPSGAAASPPAATLFPFFRETLTAPINQNPAFPGGLGAAVEPLCSASKVFYFCGVHYALRGEHQEINDCTTPKVCCCVQSISDAKRHTLH